MTDFFAHSPHLKKLRMFAGPNGSGKSTLYQNLDSKYRLGHYVNADDIEVALKKVGFYALDGFGVDFPTPDTGQLVPNSWKEKAAEGQHIISLGFENGRFIWDRFGKADRPTYEAAIIAQWMREQLLTLGQRFTFETVMSSHSKIDFLTRAKNLGYQNYLYYVATKDVLLNVTRVKNRKADGQHDVAEGLIKKRYIRSLDLLCQAVELCHRAYLIDNSGPKGQHQVILEVFPDQSYTVTNEVEIPQWVRTYFLDRW